MKKIVSVVATVFTPSGVALPGGDQKRKSIVRAVCLMAACGLWSIPAQADLSITQTTAHLSQARSYLAAGTAGDLAYFAGGETGAGYSAVVDMYDVSTGTWSSSLRGEVSPLTEARTQLSAASANNRVFFAGGTGPGYPYESKVVDVFDAAGARVAQTSIAGTPYAGRLNMAAAAADGKVFFAGGLSHLSDVWMGITTDYVDEFDALTLSHRTMNLSAARASLMGASAGNKVLFAGGHWVPFGGNGSTSSSRVDIYDVLPGTWSTAELSVARQFGAAASLTAKAIFAGGAWTGPWPTQNPTSAVDIFDALTGTWTTANLSEARYGLAGVGIGDYAFFAGGLTGPNSYSNVVDIYDQSTGLWSSLQLSEARGWLSGTVVGNQVIFAGGYGLNGSSNTVDIFTVNPVPAPGALLLGILGLGPAGWWLRKHRTE